MKNLKRAISILLLCAMCVSMLASCTATKEDDGVTTGGADTEVGSVADTEKTEDKKEENQNEETRYQPEEWTFDNLYSFDENEKPLDRLVTDGGLCSIFQTVAVIGDSLSSGTLEQDPNVAWNAAQWPSTFEPYAWSTYMARDCGFKMYNFARGGLTAREYVETYAAEQGYWAKNKKAQVYIIALGYNDFWLDQPVGTIADINFDDYKKNADSFVGDYAQIIQRYKEINPDAFFFLVTKPRHTEVETEKYRIDQRQAILDIAEQFEQTYVIDLHEYAPVYDAEFQEQFFLRNHMNPAGYRYTAVMIESYIDYYIRKDPAAFNEIGFMDTVYYTLGDKAKK